MLGTIGAPAGLASTEMNPDRDEERIIRAYVQLAITQWEPLGFRAVTVARLGALEVRLTEILEQQRYPGMPWLWLELYSPTRQHVIDSFGCTELDEFELARAVDFLANVRGQIRELQQVDAATFGCAREVLRHGPCPRSHAEPENPARRSRAHLHGR